MITPTSNKQLCSKVQTNADSTSILRYFGSVSANNGFRNYDSANIPRTSIVTWATLGKNVPSKHLRRCPCSLICFYDKIVVYC